MSYTTVALSLLIAHWIIFFAEGGNCAAETSYLMFNLPGLFCRGLMGTALIGHDLILLAALFATLRTYRRS